jgi:hypothetical protein
MVGVNWPLCCHDVIEFGIGRPLANQVREVGLSLSAYGRRGEFVQNDLV